MANEDLLIRKRSAIKAKLTNFCNHVNVLMSCDSLSSLQRIELEGRLRKFDALYDEFDNLQLEIEVLSDKPDEAYGERAKFEERYHAVAAQARSLLISADAGVDGGSVAGSADKNTGASFRHNFVRLPKINLPTFDGSYQCWLEYRDTYLSLIHSSSAIDDISKFHYLRASLTGDAQQVIKNIDFKSEHYQLAWNLLCERYDNSRLLVKNHVQTLFNTPAILKESCVALRQFVDNINKQIRALKSLNEPTDQWSTLVVIMMSSRLDKVTNRDWEEYSNTLPKFPTLSEFCSFVSKRADLLETVEHSKSTNKEDGSTNSYTVNTNNSKKNYNTTKPKPNTNKEFNNCPLCKNNHFMFVCDDFRKLSVENRLAKVKELNVCFNCLRPGHSSKRCKLSHCKYCNRKHNTLLHVEQSNSTVQDPMPSSVALPTLLTDDVSGGAQLQNGTSESVVMSSDTAATTRSVLLSTALVTVVSTRGEKFDARILLDNGSTANFITETLCHKLGLPRRNVNSTISGESYEMAKRRFLSLERRFLRDPSFKERYVAFMEEYERLGHMTENTTSRKPHSDASERAFGCCVYLRSVNMEGAVKVQLLASKNRVAPIKPTTIPRLELCGALLGARLCAKVQSSITLPITRCQFWCDSTIVLSWLAMSPNVLKPFVRNRVNEIQESTAGHTWSYVPSRFNPADLVSRGLKADLISECSLWWSGPEFLLNDETHWPAMPNKAMKQDLPEVITSNFTDHSFLTDTQKHAQHTNTSLIHTLLHKYSNINRLQRVVAYILRFYNNVKNKIKDKNPLSIKELQDSLNFILRQAQMEMFSKEYDILKAGKTLPRKNRLICLSPFVDEDGLIRVGGRLDNSPYDYNIKHPILLCCKHHITKLIFHEYHYDLLHAGPQLLIASIRQVYWPLGGRNLSKSVVKHCIKCFKFKCQNIQPVMGQLPVNRTQLEFPFLNSSVDYAGPILIADRKGRGCKLVKAYLCIFVCLAVKAVHIELVTDLTKEGYMAALSRFVARRGKPKSILSDNGTNFVGTCNELQQFLQQSNISYEVAQRGIEFTFAPPYSPHFNGIAEAAVRSTKHHLKRLLQLTHFTYEEMVTCLTQIEAVLNSRPLTPLSSDPLDFTVLTPSHFLIGRSLIAVPHPQVSDVNIGRLERYHRVEHIKQHFWNRFHLEYISLLQQKTKWTSSTGQLAEGTLVLIKERGQPPMLWPLGRVTKVFPGSDGITRVAELKTRKGTILRSFNNICPLPLD
ncbi:uncharacterized protein LOC124639459 isoform X1 [Helicoverpa zea]|uniref:uncharacterized protein LOC124639459 isoform X1 n=1 Tax=Helicoverpa zea TaxID=7113 RepID=UPI001F568F8D|nr:uncharacterized protein LOC124639459 isoform X1 [Helicoverpa zea]